MRKHTTRTLLPLLLLVAACGGDGEAEGAEAVAAVAVNPENVAFAATDRIQVGPLLSGSLEAERQATIRAEAAGTVLQVFAEQGEPVREGEPLARIEDTQVADAFRSAQSAVRSAENALAVARRDYQRAQTLTEAGALPQRELELARAQLVNAETQLADAQARLASARKAVESTRVSAPLAGVVAQRQVSAGDVVAPGAPLFTVIDPSSMQLRASVPAEALGQLRVGTPVAFRVRGYPDQTFAGEIERIAPAADPATRQVPIIVSIPNAGGTLVAGLFAEGRVEAEARQALVVPGDAVDETGARPVVVRVRGGVAERAPVELGLRDPQTERVEITAGLEPGDTLLVGAARGVTPGTPVQVGRTAAVAPVPDAQ